jgi:phosphate-selective porin OprO/OprP
MRRLPPCLFFIAAFAASGPAAADVGGWTFTPGGNFQYDWARFDADRSVLEDASDVRRARVSLGAKFGSQFEVKGEYELKGTLWTDAFVRWNFAPGQSLRVGQFKQPVYLDELTSDKVTAFMEQASPSAFAIGRRVGAEYAWAAPAWSVTATVFGHNLQGLNDGRGFGLRGTWLARQDDDGFLHLGASWAHESPDSHVGRFSARPEAALASRRLVDTGNLAGVDSIDRGGLEAAWVHGPWLLQSEYLRGAFARDAGDYAAGGWYLQGTWFPFGQQRGYKNGAIDAPKVADGAPAIELGLRYSDLDLDDGAVRGGQQRNWTLGATWWVSSNIRFMANWVRVDSQRAGLADEPDIVEFRAQLAF